MVHASTYTIMADTQTHAAYLEIVCNEGSKLTLQQPPDVFVQCIELIALQAAPFEDIDHGSLDTVPGRVGAQLQSLPGCLESGQIAEHRGAHEARPGPAEGAHLVELSG